MSENLSNERPLSPNELNQLKTWLGIISALSGELIQVERGAPGINESGEFFTAKLAFNLAYAQFKAHLAEPDNPPDHRTLEILERIKQICHTLLQFFLENQLEAVSFILLAKHFTEKPALSQKAPPPPHTLEDDHRQKLTCEQAASLALEILKNGFNDEILAAIKDFGGEIDWIKEAMSDLIYIAMQDDYQLEIFLDHLQMRYSQPREIKISGKKLPFNLLNPEDLFLLFQEDLPPDLKLIRNKIRAAVSLYAANSHINVTAIPVNSRRPGHSGLSN